MSTLITQILDHLKTLAHPEEVNGVGIRELDCEFCLGAGVLRHGANSTVVWKVQQIVCKHSNNARMLHCSVRPA